MYKAIEHILAVRSVSPSYSFDPFPGMGGLLAIETMWKNHYITFQSREAKETFKVKLLAVLVSFKYTHDEENYDTHGSSSIFAPTNPLQLLKQSQWSPITNKNGTSQGRIILNSRLLSFDIDSTLGTDMHDQESLQHAVHAMVERTLRAALSLSIDSLDESPDLLISFLNITCTLSTLPLRLLDFSSESTLCILTNLYHCLTQHALLIQGAPHRNSVTQYLRRCCYEIDGDAFSLADLEFMIRCNSSLPNHVKNTKQTQFVLPPKSTMSRLRRDYGLRISDTRLNFVLNCGIHPNPCKVIILSPNRIDNQLKQACILFLRNSLTIDNESNRILLPKVTEVYKADFGGSITAIISFCLPFIDDKENKLALCNYLKGNDQSSSGYTKQQHYEVKFQPTTWEYCTSLKPAN